MCVNSTLCDVFHKMVRASVRFNSSLHTYEWKVIDPNFDTILEIETPEHNLLIWRNFPYLSIGGCEIKDLSTHVAHIAKLPAECVSKYPLVPHFWSANMKHGGSLLPVVYNLTTHAWVETCYEDGPNNKGVQRHRVLSSIHIDLLNRVLKFDDEKRNLRYAEHQLSRQTIATEMANIAKEIPRKITTQDTWSLD